MYCCSAWHANSEFSFVCVEGGVGGRCQRGEGETMSQSRKREDRHECVERCYKEGMVISTTGEASLILT